MQIFVIIWFVVFFYIIAKGIGQFIENENSPVLTGSATIVESEEKHIITTATDTIIIVTPITLHSRPKMVSRSSFVSSGTSIKSWKSATGVC